MEIDYMELFGYPVVDLNCCKSVDYKTWGFNSFAGNILSFAPPKTTQEVIERVWKDNKLE